MSIANAHELLRNRFLIMEHIKCPSDYLIMFSYNNDYVLYITNNSEVTKTLSQALQDYDYTFFQKPTRYGAELSFASSKYLLPEHFGEIVDLCKSKNILTITAGPVRSVIESVRGQLSTYSLASFVLLDVLGFTKNSDFVYLLSDLDKVVSDLLKLYEIKEEELYKYFSNDKNKYSIVKTGESYNQIKVVFGEVNEPGAVVVKEFFDSYELMQYLLEHNIPLEEISQIIDKYNLEHEYTVGLITTEDFKNKMFSIEQKRDTLYSIIEEITGIDTNVLYYEPGYYTASVIFKLLYKHRTDSKNLSDIIYLHKHYSEKIADLYFKSLRYKRMPVKVTFDHLLNIIQKLFLGLSNKERWFAAYKEKANQLINQLISIGVENSFYETMKRDLEQFTNIQEAILNKQVDLEAIKSVLNRVLNNILGEEGGIETRESFMKSFELFIPDLENHFERVTGMPVKVESLEDLLLVLLVYEPDLLFALFLWNAFYAISKKNVLRLPQLSVEKRKRGRKPVAKLTVFTRRNYSFYETVAEHLAKKQGYGPILSLFAFYVIYRYVYTEKDLSLLNAQTVKIMKQLRDKLDLNIQARVVENHHQKLIHTHGIYKIVQAYYDYLNDKKTLLFASLYPHQVQASDKIYRAYKDTQKTGIILSHATGAGKTLTIAQGIDNILKDNPDAKVLILSKSEIINKISSELPFVCSNFSYIDVIETEQDLSYCLDNLDKLSQFVGISFSVLTRGLGLENIISTDEEVLEMLERAEEAERENLEQEIGDSIESGSSHRVILRNLVDIGIDLMKLVKFLQHFDIIVIDEAHYIKNLNISRTDGSAAVYGINLSHLGYYFGPAVSKLALSVFLSKLTLGKYVSKVKKAVRNNIVFHVTEYQPSDYRDLRLNNNDIIEDVTFVPPKRLFYILSSGTIMPNWPQDMWILLYLIGAPEEFMLHSPPEFAQHYFGAIVRGATINSRYLVEAISSIFHIMIDQGIAINYQNVLDFIENNEDLIIAAIMQVASRFTRGDVEVSVNIKQFREWMNNLINMEYIDVFSEKDAIKNNIIKPIERKVKTFEMSDRVSKIIKDLKALINDSIVFQSDLSTYIDSIELIFETIQKLRNARNRNRGRGRARKYPIIDTESVKNHGISYKNTLIEFFNKYNYMDVMENFITSVANSSRNKDVEQSKEELWRLLKEVLYGDRAIWEDGNYEIYIRSDLRLHEINPSHEQIMSDTKLIQDLQKHAILTNKFMRHVVKSIRDLIMAINENAMTYNLMKMYNVIKYLLLDNLRIWLDINMGNRTGSGKLFISFHHILVGYVLYFAYLEFAYNIFVLARKSEININKMFEGVLKRSLYSGLGFALAISVSKLGIEINTLLEAITPIVQEVNLVLDEYNRKVIGGLSTVSSLTATHVVETIKMVSSLTMLYRISAVINAFSRTNDLNKRKELTNLVVQYIVNDLYADYGADIFRKGTRFVRTYIGGVDIDEDKLIRLIDGDVQMAIKSGKDLFTFLEEKAVITKDLKNNAIDNFNREFSKLKIKLMSNKNVDKNKNKYYSDGDDGDLEAIINNLKRVISSKLGKASTKKLFISNDFINNPELKIILANTKSVAEGLNFSNASALYMLETTYTPGLLSQIEARINRINTTGDFDIVYINSDLSIEVKMNKFLIAKDFLSNIAIEMGKGLWESLMNIEQVNPESVVAEKMFVETVENYNKANIENRYYSVRYDQDNMFIKLLDEVSDEQINEIDDTIKDIEKLSAPTVDDVEKTSQVTIEEQVTEEQIKISDEEINSLLGEFSDTETDETIFENTEETIEEIKERSRPKDEDEGDEEESDKGDDNDEDDDSLDDLLRSI
ncbi:MAG: DEAD/DEAH box helicase family protein [Candidatus Bilamarchaeaceae archaeon]